VDRLPYLPVGHFFRQSKVQKDEDGLERFSAVTAIRLAAEQPFGAKTYTSRMMSRLKGELMAECRGRNLFLPTTVGGMGVTPPRGWKYHVTDEQLKKAERLVHVLDLQPRPHNCGVEVRVIRVDEEGYAPLETFRRPEKVKKVEEKWIRSGRPVANPQVHRFHNLVAVVSWPYDQWAYTNPCRVNETSTQECPVTEPVTVPSCTVTH